MLQEKNYYIEFDILKGFGILLVFLGHSFMLKGFNLTEINLWNYYIYKLIYSFHMPLFFFISGFTVKRDYNLKQFYFSKIKRLLIPYIFINIVDFILRKSFQNLVNTSSLSFREVFLFGGKTTWFIYTLFILLLIFPVIDKYIYKKNKAIYFFLILILINIVNFKVLNIRLFSIDKILYYYIYFTLGYLFKNNYSKIKKYLNIKSLYILFPLFLIQEYIPDILKTVVPLFGILIFLIFSEILRENKIKKFLIFCGKNSLTFYLLEGFVLVFVRTILIKIIPLEYNFLFIFMYFNLKIFITFIITKYFINRNEILSFLFGNKKGAY